ncbi:MAG: hypothetical protein ACLR4Z_17045 [Butyricicoccaceae bacterium]
MDYVFAAESSESVLVRSAFSRAKTAVKLTLDLRRGRSGTPDQALRAYRLG